MSIFDRWTSRKGKDSKVAPQTAKSDNADAEKKKAFASVPDGKKAKAVKTEPVSDEKSEATKSPTAAPAAQATKSLKESTDRAYRTILRPIVTEKTTGQTSSYAFEIDRAATKSDVKNAVYQVYGVRPLSVNIIPVPRRSVRYGWRYGYTAQMKKAIVTLPAGKSIDIVNA